VVRLEKARRKKNRKREKRKKRRPWFQQKEKKKSLPTCSISLSEKGKEQSDERDKKRNDLAKADKLRRQEKRKCQKNSSSAKEYPGLPRLVLRYDAMTRDVRLKKGDPKEKGGLTTRSEKERKDSLLPRLELWTYKRGALEEEGKRERGRKERGEKFRKRERFESQARRKSDCPEKRKFSTGKKIKKRKTPQERERKKKERTPTQFRKSVRGWETVNEKTFDSGRGENLHLLQPRPFKVESRLRKRKVNEV